MREKIVSDTLLSQLIKDVIKIPDKVKQKCSLCKEVVEFKEGADGFYECPKCGSSVLL